MILTRRSFGDYKDLKLAEESVIKQYFIDYDLLRINETLRCGDELSQGMRDFIADVLIKKVKRPSGKRSSTITRDRDIHLRVSYFLYKGHALTANVDAACAIVADIFKIQEEAVLKAYQKIEKEMKGKHSTTGVEQVMELFEEDAEVAKIIEARWMIL